MQNKQNNLTAGDGIVLNNDTISWGPYNALNDVDLNNFKNFYIGYVNNAVNSPSTTSGYFICIRAAGITDDRCWQIYKARSSPLIFHRYFLNNTWSQWVQLQNAS